MIVVVPVPVTRPLVTSISSTVESSLVFLIVISPVPTLTISSKVRTRSASTATSIASSAGTLETNKGFVVSASASALAGADI